jgi:hypothetical protein
MHEFGHLMLGKFLLEYFPALGQSAESDLA